MGPAVRQVLRPVLQAEEGAAATEGTELPAHAELSFCK